MARGKSREDAILSSTLEVLKAQGYQAMTIDAVAAQAHASKATIYRRWRNKAELVKAALDALDAEDSAAIPDTGALRSDLLAVMKGLRAKATAPYVAMLQDLIAAARRDATLAALLRAHVEDDALSPFQAVLRRAVRRGTLSRTVDTELLHDVAEALVLRRLHTGQALDSRFITRVVDGVLLPLLTPRRGRT